MFPISNVSNHPHASTPHHNSQHTNTAAVSQSEERQASNEQESRPPSAERGSIGDTLQIRNRAVRLDLQDTEELPPPYGDHEQDALYHPPVAPSSRREQSHHQEFEAWLHRNYQQFIRNHPEDAHDEAQFEYFLERQQRRSTAGEDMSIRHAAKRSRNRGNHHHASADYRLPTLFGFPVIGSSNGFSRDLYAESLADDNPFSRGMSALQPGHNHRRQMARPSVGARRPERQNP